MTRCFICGRENANLLVSRHGFKKPVMVCYPVLVGKELRASCATEAKDPRRTP